MKLPIKRSFFKHKAIITLKLFFDFEAGNKITNYRSITYPLTQSMPSPPDILR